MNTETVVIIILLVIGVCVLIDDSITKSKELKKFHDFQQGIGKARKEILNNGYQFAVIVLARHHLQESDEFLEGYSEELKNQKETQC